MCYKIELAETLRGKGTVFSGEKLIAEAPYFIKIYERYQESPMLDGSKTHTFIDKNIEVTINQNLPSSIDEKLVLRIEDGRTMEFYWWEGTASAAGDLR